MKNDPKRTDAKAMFAFLFIPGALFIGMGFGFLYGHLVAGLFIGLGAGMVLGALAMTGRKTS